MKNSKILVLGVTASGKGKLAFELARDFGGEIISVDSMKIYKRMDIGTAKPGKEFRDIINHHLIDVVEPSQPFDVARFMELSTAAAEDIQSRNKPVISVGGTALYIKAMLYGLFEGPGTDESIRNQLKQQALTDGMQKLYEQLQKADPAAAERIHPNDKKRIIRALEVYKLTGKPISHFQQQFDCEPVSDWKIIGLRRDKQQESSRINQRVKRMIEQGLVDEVKGLLAEDKPLSKQALCAIGYAEIIDHLQGKMSLEDAIEKIKINTRYFAKHQRTWFKTFKNVNWIDIKPDQSLAEIVAEAKTILTL